MMTTRPRQQSQPHQIQEHEILHYKFQIDILDQVKNGKNHQPIAHLSHKSSPNIELNKNQYEKTERSSLTDIGINYFDFQKDLINQVKDKSSLTSIKISKQSSNQLQPNMPYRLQQEKSEIESIGGSIQTKQSKSIQPNNSNTLQLSEFSKSKEIQQKQFWDQIDEDQDDNSENQDVFDDLQLTGPKKVRTATKRQTAPINVINEVQSDQSDIEEYQKNALDDNIMTEKSVCNSQNQKNPEKINDYIILNCIKQEDNHSMHLRLFLACDEQGKRYTMKQINKQQIVLQNIEKEEQDQLHLEVKTQIALFKRTNHNGIIKIIDVIEDNNYFYIFTEYLSRGSIYSDQFMSFQQINDQAKSSYILNESKIQNYIFQVLQALDYLHNVLKIYHTNIKPDTLFLNEYYNLKIDNFGFFGRLISYGTQNINLQKELIFFPPETHKTKFLLYKNVNNEKTDIWQIGIYLYFLMFRQLPFQNMNKTEYLKEAEKFQIPRNNFSIEANDFLQKCLLFNCEERISLQNIFEHDWLKPKNYKLFREKIHINFHNNDINKAVTKRKVEVFKLAFNLKKNLIKARMSLQQAKKQRELE